MLLDAFLKLEEPALEGESTDKGHLKEIEIISFEQSVVRVSPTTGKTGTADKPRSEHKPLTVLKVLDKASPKLYQAACGGTLYKKATLTLCQPDGTSKTTSDSWKKIVYMQIVMETVHIVRMHLVGDPSLHRFGRAADFPLVAGNVLNMGPLEELDLTYEKIQWLYKGGTGKMNFQGTWNLKTNKPT